MLASEAMTADRPVHPKGQTANADLLLLRIWWAGLALILVYALALAIPNAFLKDGFIYLAMVDALVREGSLSFSNGWETYGSDGLTQNFTVPHEGRLMPQYPSGWAFLAAPFWALGGIRGLFLLNALATCLTLWLMRIAGEALFDRRTGLIAGILLVFATYTFDYAGAVWPHAVAVACSMGAVTAAALAWRDDRPVLWAVSGLCIGLGIHMRVDAILFAPAIGVWALGVARQPYRAAALLFAGFLPAALLACWINWEKFGVPSPITYGDKNPEGGTSLARYAGFVPFLIAAGLAGLSLGLDPVRRRLLTPVGLGAVAALGLVLIVAVEPARTYMTTTLMRALGLVGMLDVFPQYLAGSPQPDARGVVLIHDYAKKALLESVPYAAAIVVLIPALFRHRWSAGIALCLLSLGAVISAFAPTGWFGGKANHMRYLLPVLPPLCLLAALALQRIRAFDSGPRAVALAAGIGLPLLATVWGIVQGRPLSVAVQHDAAHVLIVATAGLGLLALALPAAGAALRGVAVAGIVLAAISAWGGDLLAHQGFRAGNLALTHAVRPLPRDAVFNVLYPTWAFERLEVPETLIAGPPGSGGRYYDEDLIARVLAEGRPVYVQHPGVAKMMVEEGLASGFEPAVEGETAYFSLVRLVP